MLEYQKSVGRYTPQLAANIVVRYWWREIRFAHPYRQSATLVAGEKVVADRPISGTPA
jgi:hypothetical protein